MPLRLSQLASSLVCQTAVISRFRLLSLAPIFNTAVDFVLALLHSSNALKYASRILLLELPIKPRRPARLFVVDITVSVALFSTPPYEVAPPLRLDEDRLWRLQLLTHCRALYPSVPSLLIFVSCNWESRPFRYMVDCTTRKSRLSLLDLDRRHPPARAVGNSSTT